MRLAGLNQLAVAVKESLKALAIEHHTEDVEKYQFIQNSYIDSVEFSDRAIKLSMEADTEKGLNQKFDKGIKEESNINQGQEGPDTSQHQEPAFTEVASLNVLA